MVDGVYRRHPPDGDREQPFRLPNQRDWGTPEVRSSSANMGERSILNAPLARDRGAMLKAGRGQSGGEHGSDEEIEAHGDPKRLKRLCSM